MFLLWFNELTKAQETDIETATAYILNSILAMNDSKKLMQNEKVIAKYDKLSNATIDFIDTIYTYDMERIKDSAHELKKAISNFGYDAKKVDKRMSNKINNMKFKRNIDDVVNYLDEALAPEKEEEDECVLQLSW